MLLPDHSLNFNTVEMIYTYHEEHDMMTVAYMYYTRVGFEINRLGLTRSKAVLATPNDRDSTLIKLLFSKSLFNVHVTHISDGV